MKSKFQNLDFGSVALLSQNEQRKVTGGYSGGGPGGVNTYATCTGFCRTGGFFGIGGTSTNLAATSISGCGVCNSDLHRACGSGTLSPGPCYTS